MTDKPEKVGVRFLESISGAGFWLVCHAPYIRADNRVHAINQYSLQATKIVITIAQLYMLLADRTVAQIGIILSVCLSVTLCTVALRVGL